MHGDVKEFPGAGVKILCPSFLGEPGRPGRRLAEQAFSMVGASCRCPRRVQLRNPFEHQLSPGYSFRPQWPRAAPAPARNSRHTSSTSEPAMPQPLVKFLTVRNLITPSRSTPLSSPTPKNVPSGTPEIRGNAPGNLSQSAPASRKGRLSQPQRGGIPVDSEPPKTKAP
jgi:hypothetical protein